MMLSYRVPTDRNEQTQQLIEAGVAAIALQSLHSFHTWTADISIEECYYWATRNNELLYQSELPVPVIEIAVQYPYRSENGTYHSVYGTVVAAGGEPYIGVYSGGSLSPEQIAFVTQLAGAPPERWF